MADILYQQALDANGTEPVELFRFGPNDEALWAFDPGMGQLAMRLVGKGQLWVTYSGEASTITNKPVYFQCAPHGEWAEIGQNEFAYFSQFTDDNYAKYDEKMSVEYTGQYVTCPTVTCVFTTDLNARWEFDFMLKNFEELTTVLIAGVKLNA